MRKLSFAFVFVLMMNFIMLSACKNSRETVSIITDRTRYTPAMSSARGIGMMPDFKPANTYNELEYRWTAEKGGFLNYSGDAVKSVVNQGEQVLWSAIENDRVVDIKDDFDIQLKIVERKSNKVIASSKLTIGLDDKGFYEVKGKSNKLTLEKVKQLAKKGEKLTWEDFKEYEGTDVGSGLYIVMYPVDDKYKILIGGGSLKEKPMYVYLVKNDSKDNNERIDIRYDDIDKFTNSVH